MSILDDIFFGERTPNGNYPTDENYDKAVETILKNEEILLANLHGRDKKLFLQYANAHCITGGTEAVGYFKLGFKMGARLMTEIYED